jgi:hypothetical protein
MPAYKGRHCPIGHRILQADEACLGGIPYFAGGYCDAFSFEKEMRDALGKAPFEQVRRAGHRGDLALFGAEWILCDSRD